MNIKYVVDLSEDERGALEALLAGGKKGVRTVQRAQILLSADQGMTDEAIAAAIRVGTSTVYRVKRRLVEGGLERALTDQPRPGSGRKLSGKEEALLIAIACSAPPQGRSKWTTELLAGELVQRTEHASISRETVRRRLAENEMKPWQKKMWCVPKVDAEYVARMEDVLDLYADEADPDRPVVCFDETPVQLIGETRTPLPPKPGQPALYDYEYRRNGTANIFMMVDAHRPWRHAKVTERRTAIDFAEAMRDLVDVHYPDASVIRVVKDNLSTHSMGALYAAFEPAEARRILKRLEFHYTPKHASWLNMAEIEIGVMSRQCLDRRISEITLLRSETSAWSRQRNESGSKTQWMFTVSKAREKMAKAYPAARASAVLQPTTTTVAEH